jgi:uncharacterized protein YecT (DUF1311 family)
MSAIAAYPRDGTGRKLDMSHTVCRTIFVLVLSALAAACAMTAEQQAQSDGERCAARGLQVNSKAHDECITGLQSQRDARLQRRHQELVERPSTPDRR